jgi:hypothetical protein
VADGVVSDPTSSRVARCLERAFCEVNARALGAPDAASAIAKIEGLMMMDDRMM